MAYNNDAPKVHFPDGVNGGDELDVESGGAIVIQTGGSITGTRIERKILSVSVPSATAGVASAIIDQVMSSLLPTTIKSVKLIPAGNCAGHATSNFTLSLRNAGTGATTTQDIATLTLTTGNALTTNVPKEFTVSATGGQTVAAGESLVYAIALASLGIDTPKGKLVVEYVIQPT